VVWLLKSWCVSIRFSVQIVATLALGSRPRQGFARDWAKKETPECGRMWEGTLTLPSWTPMLGVRVLVDSRNFREQLQRAKPLALKSFIISLESYWSVRVQNGLIWPIWTSVTQVMVKRKVGSQTGNLTPNHEKSGIVAIPLHAGGVRHAVRKLSMRAMTSV
jgi:hypothetical protein